MQEVAGLFSDLEDPRRGNAKRHDFSELLFIALCTVMRHGEMAPLFSTSQQQK